MSRLIEAPFTDEQIRMLNHWQELPTVHPFTCGGEHVGEVILAATTDGWICTEGCGYMQDWAHKFMADPTLHASIEDTVKWMKR